MIYFAKVTKESSKSYLVEFPELEGCLTEGTTLDKALDNAEEALNGWLASNCDRSLNIPEAKLRRGKNYYSIEVDIKVAFAIMLRKARKKRGLSQAAVAKRMGITQQAYAKLETPQQANPSLVTIQRLSEALDMELELKLVS